MMRSRGVGLCNIGVLGSKKMFFVSEEIKVAGMHCKSCELLIEEIALGIDGVVSLEVDYITGRGEITFNSERTTIEGILREIEGGGYVCSLIGGDGGEEKRDLKGYVRLFGMFLVIAGMITAGYFLFTLSGTIGPSQIGRSLGYGSYGLLFVVGLLTGFHCLGMCGGFVVSYTTKGIGKGSASHRSHLMYGLGKMISYTVIGAGFGLLGSVVAFTPTLRGTAGILSGLFLVLFGLNMFGLLPKFGRFRISTPSVIQKFKGMKGAAEGGPFVIGLLNGLMIACGPLQAIYVMAAGTGSVKEGALLLFFFALGTLPVMLGFGYITGLVSNRFRVNMVKWSGAVVAVLGLVMINRGLALTGTGLDAKSLFASVSVWRDKADIDFVPVVDGYQIVRMNVTRYGWEPDSFTLKEGIPVKWIINAEEINNCNNAIQVPVLKLFFNITPGERIIEFTPESEGVISWNCWMGMIPGTFIVKKGM